MMTRIRRLIVMTTLILSIQTVIQHRAKNQQPETKQTTTVPSGSTQSSYQWDE